MDPARILALRLLAVEVPGVDVPVPAVELWGGAVKALVDPEHLRVRDSGAGRHRSTLVEDRRRMDSPPLHVAAVPTQDRIDRVGRHIRPRRGDLKDGVDSAIGLSDPDCGPGKGVRFLDGDQDTRCASQEISGSLGQILQDVVLERSQPCAVRPHERPYALVPDRGLIIRARG
jgi:hypothetical protein